MRLAEEYDAAQARGEVAKRGWESGVDKGNITTSADLGLRRDEIHEARKLRGGGQISGAFKAATRAPQARAISAKFNRGVVLTKKVCPFAHRG